MKLRTVIVSLMLLLFTASFAEEKDTAFANLYRRYLELYTDSDEAAFYQATEQMKAHYLKKQNMDSYYKVFLNEILYDTEQGKTYRAIKKCSDMLQEMKEKNENHYDIVYSALGNIYDLRGNYRMAKKYYHDALKACNPSDTGSLISIYSRIAHYKVYVVLKGEISFYLKDKKHYEEAYQQYLKCREEHPMLDAYGRDLMNILHATFTGDYQTALEILSHDSPDFDPLDRCDMRIQIYEMMGEKEKALREVDYRRDLRDSLNSDMLFNNINEINGEIGLQKIKEEALEKEEKATKRQNLLLSIALIMVVAALGLVISRNLMRRRYQKKLMKQNKELEVALSRAEESDRMKDSFIKHVSHEIRTPLNIITGYAQIINNPDYDLTEEERSRMLSDISKNTQLISYIVNELLEVAEDESKQHYSKDDIIAVNEFCRRLIGQAEMKNKGRLSLEFISELDDDYTVHSNRRAIEKVLEQLLDNAMKFTNTGYVELKVHDSPDHGVVRFIVQDSGIGISEENQHRIFDRFFKEDVFKQGFGLGLTMSLKMAILLGGSLSLDREYKAGARFILTIPVKS